MNMSKLCFSLPFTIVSDPIESYCDYIFICRSQSSCSHLVHFILLLLLSCVWINKFRIAIHLVNTFEQQSELLSANPTGKMWLNCVCFFFCKKKKGERRVNRFTSIERNKAISWKWIDCMQVVISVHHVHRTLMMDRHRMMKATSRFIRKSAQLKKPMRIYVREKIHHKILYSNYKIERYIELMPANRIEQLPTYEYLRQIMCLHLILMIAIESFSERDFSRIKSHIKIENMHSFECPDDCSFAWRKLCHIVI